MKTPFFDHSKPIIYTSKVPTYLIVDDNRHPVPEKYYDSRSDAHLMGLEVSE